MENVKKNLFVIVVFSVLTIILVTEYIRVIPFNADPFKEMFRALVWPIILLIITGTATIFTIYKRKIISVWGIIILIFIAIKPLLNKKPRQETLAEFFFVRKNSLESILGELKAGKELKSTHKRMKSLGFSSIRIEGDTYIFIIDSFLDNSNGILYDLDNNLPTSILSGHTSTEIIIDHWYYFTTT